MNVGPGQFVGTVLVERRDSTTVLGRTTDANSRVVGIRTVWALGVVEEVPADGVMVPLAELRSGLAKLSRDVASRAMRIWITLPEGVAEN